jgi:hypothetical protein
MEYWSKGVLEEATELFYITPFLHHSLIPVGLLLFPFVNTIPFR